MFANKDFQRIENRLIGHADRPFFDLRVQNLIALTKALCHFRQFRCVGKHFEKVFIARQRVFDTGKTELDHDCCCDGIAGGHAGEIERLFDVIEISRPARHAGRLLHGVGQQMAHLGLIELHEQRNGGGGTKDRSNGVCTVFFVIQMRWAEG